MNIIKQFPMGHAFQIGVAMGYIKNDIYISQDSNNSESHYCTFILTTRTSDDKHTELHCYLTGDEAHSFFKDFRKMDLIQLWFEVNHTYEFTTQHVKNRLHVLGWASFKNIPYGDFPEMTNDEYAFINKMLEIYRNQAPLPSVEEVYVWKSIKNNWSKERRKKSVDKDEVANIVEDEEE